MATPENPFKIYDVVTATNQSIQFAHDSGLTCPPTDEVTVVALSGDNIILSDGSSWHFSHFRKVGALVDLQREAADAAFDELLGEPTFVGDFNEMAYVDELAEYIKKTYGEHYAKDGVQTFELIVKRPARGLHFTLSNIMKYADRFGEKDGMNRKDLLKIAHYAILSLFAYDQLEMSK